MPPAPPTGDEIGALDRDGVARGPSRELKEDVLDLVVGGAGDPPPAVMDRLRRVGAVRTTTPSRRTGP